MTNIFNKPISVFKKDLKFWIKILQFCIFLSLILSQIVLFVAEDMSAYYGTTIMRGIGIMITSVSWIIWHKMTTMQQFSKYYASEITFMCFVILGTCLVPHALTFTITGLIIIVSVLFGIYRANTYSKTLHQ